MSDFWDKGTVSFDDVPGMASGVVELRQFVVSPFSTNCYAVVCAGQALVIDPGAAGERIASALKDAEVALVAATHGHADHVGGVAALVEATGAPFAISAEDAELAQVARSAHAFGIEYDDDAPAPSRLLSAGDIIGVGEARFEVVPTPGHTPGGVCLVGRDAAAGLAFVGDTLFAGSAGRTDLAGGSTPQLMRSLSLLATTISAPTHLLCGHGDDTTMSWELATNPYLR